MTAILSLALKNWKLVAIGGLVLALLTGFGIHKVIVADWKSDLADVKEKHAACKVDKKTLEGSLEAQNKAVEALREKAAANQREAEKRAQEARVRSERSRQREMSDDRSGAVFMNQWMSDQF